MKISTCIPVSPTKIPMSNEQKHQMSLLKDKIIKGGHSYNTGNWAENCEYFYDNQTVMFSVFYSKY